MDPNNNSSTATIEPSVDETAVDKDESTTEDFPADTTSLVSQLVHGDDDDVTDFGDDTTGDAGAEETSADTPAEGNTEVAEPSADDDPIILTAAERKQIEELFGPLGGDTKDGESANAGQDAQPATDKPAEQTNQPPLTLSALSVPEIKVTQEEFDEIMNGNADKFNEFMTKRDQAVAAHTATSLMRDMTPAIYATVAMAYEQLSETQKLLDKHPEYEQMPTAFTRALAAAKRNNPNGKLSDLLADVEKQLDGAIALRDKIKNQGKRVDVRPPRKPVSHPGASPRIAANNADTADSEDDDPTFATLGGIINRRKM